MIDGEALLLVQFLCFTISFIMAVMLFMSRVHQRNTFVGYETSRWMLISALLLLAIHFWLQMIYGFRARSEELGALINILFYAPVVYLFTFATIRMSCGPTHLRNYLIVSGVSMALIIGSFLCGIFFEFSFEKPYALYIMCVLLFISVSVITIMTHNEISRVRKRVEEETANDIRNYDLYMRVGTTLLYGTCLFLVLFIFSSFVVIYIVAPLFLVGTLFYIVSFMALGFNVSSVGEVIDEAITEVIGEKDKEEEVPVDDDTNDSLSPLQIAAISTAIDEWKKQRGYSVTNLTSYSLAERIGISKKRLGLYLSEYEGKTFRVWLSDIRIEEVKRMLLENTEYSNEAIASECGFSSRSWMQEKFKANTGLTPNEWRANKLKGEKESK